MSGAEARPPLLRLGVLIGGGGRTLLNIHDHIERGDLNAAVAVVIASRPDLAGVERARQRGFDVRIVRPQARIGSSAPNDGACGDDALSAALCEAGVDLVCLAGYLKPFRIDPPFVNRVINIHPALLPSFGGKGMYGLHVHRAVLERGCRVSGCTVHYLNDVYDDGPIILQRACPVLEGDTPETLAARVFREECIAYPEAIGLIASGRVKLEGSRVRIVPAMEAVRAGQVRTGNPMLRRQ